MNTNSPTHEQITRRAQELWQARGQPTGRDHEIWLEAERQLAKPTAANNSPSATEGRGNGNTQGSNASADPKPADLKQPKVNQPAAESKAPGNTKGPSANTPASPSNAKGSAAGTKTAPAGTKSTPNNPQSSPDQTKRLKGEMASESAVEFNISPPIPEEDAIKAALQKRTARAPQAPATNAPHAKPAESGKPLWDKPHSK